MNITRRSLLGELVAGAALAFAPDSLAKIRSGRFLGRPALQLYSLRKWISVQDTVGKIALAKALKEIRAIGFEAVEFAGYYGARTSELKAMLSDAGLAVCGAHVDRMAFGPTNIAKTCETNLAFGNDLLICPGMGNFPKKDEKLDDFLKMLVDFYNKAADDAAKFGCKIGLHNHTKEFSLKMEDGTTYWDYFFSHTDSRVCMEQDVGWTTCAGVDPKVQYGKYPHRSPSLHAKENGFGKDVKTFDGILGKPGIPGARPVDWDGLFPVTDADGVKWYVVECECHFDNPKGAVVPSFEFLVSKGRV